MSLLQNKKRICQQIGNREPTKYDRNPYKYEINADTYNINNAYNSEKVVQCQKENRCTIINHFKSMYSYNYTSKTNSIKLNIGL